MRNLLDAALEATVVGSFSRIGHDVRSRLGGWDTDYPLAGSRLLITGGTSGIGRAAARRAVECGAQVAITGRDAVRTERIATQMGAIGIAADAADLDRMRGLVEVAQEALGGLDVLVNNAGALDDTYAETPEGFERTYAVHVLAPFILTTTALSAVTTVITVSSGGMYTQPLRPRTMQMDRAHYDGVTAYARAKRVQVALNAEWARRYPQGPTFAAMHPGWADTPGVEQSLPRFRRITGPILRTPDQGADTVLWLASHEVPSGRFWLDRTPRGTTRLPWLSYGPDEQRLAWETAADQTGMSDLLKGATPHGGKGT